MKVTWLCMHKTTCMKVKLFHLKCGRFSEILSKSYQAYKTAQTVPETTI